MEERAFLYLLVDTLYLLAMQAIASLM